MSVAEYLILILKAGRATLKILFKEVLKTKRLNTPLSIRHKSSVYARTYRHTICCACLFLRAMDFLLHFAVQDRRIGPPGGDSATVFQRGMQGHLCSFWEGSLNFKRPLILANKCEMEIWCLWFRVSLIYMNHCPTRCNTKQSIYYSARSLCMFRVPTTPIIRSTQNSNHSLRYWLYFLLAWPRWREVAAPVPEAVVTVLCTPDDGCGWHPKHAEWTCRIINRLFCVASRWIINNMWNGKYSIVNVGENKKACD